MPNYVLTRAAELEALPYFRDFIARVCAERGISATVAFDLQLATDEAMTNVIQHGYAGMNPGSLMLELRPGPQRVTVIITDFGHPFEPVQADAVAPDVNALLQDRPTSGFGLYFIYRTMDDVNYFTDEQGNHLVLLKRLVAGANPN